MLNKQKNNHGESTEEEKTIRRGCGLGAREGAELYGEKKYQKAGVDQKETHPTVDKGISFVLT